MQKIYPDAKRYRVSARTMYSKREIVILIPFLLILLISLAKPAVMANRTFLSYVLSDGVHSEKHGSTVQYANGSSWGYGLGWLPEEIPEGSRVKPTFRAALPTYFDWRSYNGYNWMTFVKDQLTCGSCVAFGSVGGFEGLIKIRTNNPSLSIDLSEQHLFSCGGGSCQTGWYISNALNYLRDYGTPDESCLPYTAVDNNCGSSCSDWQSRSYKISGWSWVDVSPASIEAALQNGPLVAAFDVYEDFYGCKEGHPNCGYSGYAGGIYYHTGGEYVGGHCVTIVGYDSTQGYWICKNSWGDTWGESGYFRIGFGQCGIEQWVASMTYSPPVYTVTFYTNPTSWAGSAGSITVDSSVTYTNGQTGQYTGTHTVLINVPSNYQLVWTYGDRNPGGGGTGVYVPNIGANPTTMDVNGNGWLKAEFSALITFYTNPSSGGSISYGGNTYTNGQTRWEGSLPPAYSNTVTITANPPAGYTFTSWSTSGMLNVANPSSNPTTLTVNGPGTLIANFAGGPVLQISNLEDDVVEAAEYNVYFIYPNYEGVKPPGVSPALLSDWTATGFMIGMCSNPQYEVTDTNPMIIDTSSGTVKLQGKIIVLFGGPLVNAPVHYYEANRLAPLYFQNDGGVWYWYRADGTRLEGTGLTPDQMKSGQNMFVVEAFTDNSGNRVFIVYGYGWKGTFAGGKFFKFVIYPNIGSYTASYYVFKWVDSNGDGFVDLDEVSTNPVASA